MMGEPEGMVTAEAVAQGNDIDGFGLSHGHSLKGMVALGYDHDVSYVCARIGIELCRTGRGL